MKTIGLGFLIAAFVSTGFLFAQQPQRATVTVEKLKEAISDLYVALTIERGLTAELQSRIQVLEKENADLKAKLKADSASNK